MRRQENILAQGPKVNKNITKKKTTRQNEFNENENRVREREFDGRGEPKSNGEDRAEGET